MKNKNYNYYNNLIYIGSINNKNRRINQHIYSVINRNIT